MDKFSKPKSGLFSENRLIAKTPLQTIREGIEGKETQPEEKEVSPIEKELLEVSDKKHYEAFKDLKTNVDELLHIALKLKYRTWYLPEIWSTVLSHAHEWKNLIPDLGKKPEENQVSEMALEAGQIVFLNEEGKELLRIDISMAFRAKQSMFEYYGYRKEVEKRKAEKKREKESERERRTRMVHYIASRGLGPAEPKPKGKPIKIDQNEARQNFRIMEHTDRDEKNKQAVLKEYRLAPESGYNLRVTLHPTITQFSDDDWSAGEDGKWKDVIGRTSVERLLIETIPAPITYDAFLKSREDKLKTVAPVIRELLTGNSEKDRKKIQELKAGVDRAEKDKRIKWEYSNYHDAIKTADGVLEEYEKQKAKAPVHYLNPFAFHGWTVDNIQQVAQDGYNEYFDFDHLAERLYENEKNFTRLREKLKELGIPEIVLKHLKGKNLNEDFEKFDKFVLEIKQIEEDPEKFKTASREVKEIHRYKTQVKMVWGILGDYIHFSVRLMNLMRHLKYRVPEALTKGMQKREGGDIFQLQRETTGHLSDNPDMALAKVLLAGIFFKGVEKPERFFTLGEKFWGFLSGEDTAERIITMRDFTGGIYSVDRAWFNQRLSSETAYKVVYEYAREKGTPETNINFEKAKEKLRKLLELGISAYSMRPDENFHKMLDRNNIERTGNFDEDIKALYKKFEQELDGFIKNLRTLKTRYTQLPAHILEDFFEKHELSDDLLEFIKIGSVIDYHKKGIEQNREIQSYNAKLQAGNIEKIINALAQTKAFSEKELQRIREGLTAGLVVTNQGGFGLGASIPLPHGYYISAGFPVTDWKNFGMGAGIGKKIEVTEKLNIQLHAGAGISGKGFFPGGLSVLSYDFDNVSVYALGAGAPAGFYAGIGIERRPEVLARETIDRKMLEAHIKGKEGENGLDDYSPEGRYAIVSRNPDAYPEFREILASLDALGFDSASKSIVFEAFYEIYKEELERQALAESFPIIRGIGLGAGIATPDNLLNIVMPFKFGIASRTLILRAADIAGIENYSQRMTKEELLKKYENAKISLKTIEFAGKIIIDRNGNLSLSNANVAPLTLDENRQFGNLRDSLEKDLDIEVGAPDKNGLVEIFPHRAYGEVILAIDPDLKDKVLVVHDNNHTYLSVSRDQKVYITREDITYPFMKEGAVETTYITVRGNPYIDRRGPGSTESMSRENLFRRRGMKWRIEKNPEAPISETKQILSMVDYNNLLAKDPEFANLRLKQGDQERFENAYRGLMETISVADYETQKPENLPEIFTATLNELKRDENFMERFREIAVKGYDFKEKKANPGWSENLPGLIEHIKEGFARKEIPELNELAIEKALTEFVIASFIDLSNYVDQQKSYEAALEAFGRPMLESIFSKYFNEKYADLTEAKRKEKTDKAVNYMINQMKAVNLEKSEGKPLEEDSYFASLVGTKGVRGIRRLYNPHRASETYGMLLPSNAMYYLNSSNETVRDIARFWLDYLSPMPEKSPEDSEKISEILRSPLALRLAPFAGAFLNAEELELLTQAYKKAEFPKETRSAVEKFLKICREVRQAQLQGKKEYHIEGANYTIVINRTEVKMGVYKKCGNISAVVKEDFELKEIIENKFFAVSKDDVVVTTKTGSARVDYGIFLGPSVVVPLKEEPALQGMGVRVLPGP